MWVSCDGGGHPVRKIVDKWHDGVAQATSMSADTITEDAVYQCTGNPLPKDIEQVAHWLLNERFTDAFQSERPYCPACGSDRVLVVWLIAAVTLLTSHIACCVHQSGLQSFNMSTVCMCRGQRHVHHQGPRPG